MRKQRKEVDLDLIAYRYHNGSREEKSKLLDELCDLYGYSRKYLLQFFNRLTGKKYVSRGCKRKYDPAIFGSCRRTPIFRDFRIISLI